MEVDVGSCDCARVRASLSKVALAQRGKGVGSWGMKNPEAIARHGHIRKGIPRGSELGMSQVLERNISEDLIRKPGLNRA
jgi:hypothetical protein